MATVADSPSAKQPREKSVVMLKTLVITLLWLQEMVGNLAVRLLQMEVLQTVKHLPLERLSSAVLFAAVLSQLGAMLNVCWKQISAVSDTLGLRLPLLDTLGTVAWQVLPLCSL